MHDSKMEFGLSLVADIYNRSIWKAKAEGSEVKSLD
jgi:hypothetical protein